MKLSKSYVNLFTNQNYFRNSKMCCLRCGYTYIDKLKSSDIMGLVFPNPRFYLVNL